MLSLSLCLCVSLVLGRVMRALYRALKTGHQEGVGAGGMEGVSQLPLRKSEPSDSKTINVCMAARRIRLLPTSYFLLPTSYCLLPTSYSQAARRIRRANPVTPPPSNPSTRAALDQLRSLQIVNKQFREIPESESVEVPAEAPDVLTRLLDAPPFAMPPLDVLPMLSCRSSVSESAGGTARCSEVGTARSSARSLRTIDTKWEYIPTPALSARGTAELRREPSQMCLCAQQPNLEMGPQGAVEAQAAPQRGRAPVPPLNVRPAAKLVRRDTQLLLDAGVVRSHALVVGQPPVPGAPHGASAVVPPAGSSPAASSLTACLVGGLRMPSLRSAASPRRLSPRRSVLAAPVSSRAVAPVI